MVNAYSGRESQIGKDVEGSSRSPNKGNIRHFNRGEEENEIPSLRWQCPGQGSNQRLPVYNTDALSLELTCCVPDLQK
jgi:hypothetical protein